MPYSRGGRASACVREGGGWVGGEVVKEALGLGQTVLVGGRCFKGWGGD